MDELLEDQTQIIDFTSALKAKSSFELCKFLIFIVDAKNEIPIDFP